MEPGAFKDSQIADFRLNNNKLRKVPSGVFNGTKFELINLSNNKISDLEEGCFYDMSKVYEIVLTNNFLEKFDLHRFRNVPILTFVTLKGNPVFGKVNVTEFQQEIPFLHSFQPFEDFIQY